MTHKTSVQFNYVKNSNILYVA
uniref:Uncharacterized protein n=1 Tax=Anguilla anguilla TaxID=7936 RepID=A0A0E9QME6_ANGAN